MESTTILLVEDCDEVRRLMGDILQSQGYRVLEARSGDAALQVFNKFRGRIDLLVSDITMPGMDGFELRRYWIDNRPGIPVLLISGFAHDFCGESIPFLAKPFTPDQLLSKVKELTRPPDLRSRRAS
jgi:two-component system cell cycle sensor histidine kinase/response regulator CckA